MLDVADAVASVFGPGRVGMHLAPRADSHSMGDSDLAATFGYAAAELGKRGIAFLCAREYDGADSLGVDLKKAFGGVYIANEKFTGDDGPGGPGRRQVRRHSLRQGLYRQSGPGGAPATRRAAQRSRTRPPSTAATAGAMSTTPP